jgi:hypothetical protein
MTRKGRVIVTYREHAAQKQSIFKPHVQGGSCFSIASQMNTHKVWKDCKYNEAELFSIMPYKSDFISSSTHDRMVILRKKILPAMFNYWLENGKDYNSIESNLLSKVVHFMIFLIRLIYNTESEFRNLRSGVQTIGVWRMVTKKFRDFRPGA